MRRVLVIVSILWMYSLTLFAQEVKLTVHDKPLNTVLGMLGIEISFDDAALAAYRVSVSKTFETAEETLGYLLKDKPFKIEKMNSVYIIIPDGQKLTDIPAPTVTTKIKGSEYGHTNSVLLDEVTVTGNRIFNEADRTRYFITASMLQGVSDIEELLDKMPEVYVDRASNLIKVNNSKEILLLADGIPQPADYIRKLPPERIQSVEIINEPAGRFLSGNYTAVINFILKKDYRGHDVFLSNVTGVRVTEVSGNKGVTAEKPTLGLSYTHHKVNMYATYTFNHEKQHVPIFKGLSYYGMPFNSIDDKETPTDLYKRNSHTATGGVSYQMTPTQLIGIQGDYVSGQTNTLKQTNIQSKQQHAIRNITENSLTDNTFVGTLFYQGQLNDRFQLYGDFSYNYYYNDINNNYIDTQSKQTVNRYNEFKNHTLLNFEGKYRLSSRSSIQAGYSHSWRKYGSGNNGEKDFLDYSEYRNRAFAYLTVNLSKRIQGKAGAAIEHIKLRGTENDNRHVRFLPYMQANFAVSKKLNIRASYSTNQHYPLLYQLSPMNTVIDTFLIQIGNPRLKTPVRHQVSLRLSLWNKLIVNSVYQYTRNEISELYTENGTNLYRSFENTNIKEYSLQVTYDQALWKYFRFRNSVTYYVGQSSDAQSKTSPCGWLANSEISYYHPKKLFGFRLGYHRNMKKQVLIQGYQMFDKDYWLISANKTFWNNRISATLSYIPPVSWGIRKYQSRELNTSFYKEKTNLYIKPYNNILLLKINIRLNRGNSKSVKHRNPIKKNEREKQTIHTINHYTDL